MTLLPPVGEQQQLQHDQYPHPGIPGTTPNKPGYMAPPPHDSASRLLEQEPNYPIFVGLYGYDSRHDDELSFCKGDLLNIISTEKGNWWYARSQSTGKEGYIPSNFVVEWKSLASYPASGYKSLDAEEYVNQFAYT